MEIRFNQLIAKGATSTLNIEQWAIAPKESWAVFSTEGDIGSLLGELLVEELAFEGELHVDTGIFAQVSFVEQQRLLDDELAKDDTDFLDRIDAGSTVYALIFEQCHDDALTQKLIDELDLNHLKESGFRVLQAALLLNLNQP